MVIWTLAKKDLRLLMRDVRAIVILLAMPLIFITVLGVSLGENFGRKVKLRISVLNLDKGLPHIPGQPAPSFPPGGSWSEMVISDLTQTSDIDVQTVTRDEATQLVKSGRRAAVLVLGPEFSQRVQYCSFLDPGWKRLFDIAASYPVPGRPIELMLSGCFSEFQDVVPLYLADGINPFYRDGIRFDSLDVRFDEDPTQSMSAAIVKQVAQGSLLRIVMPWMIGRAFEKIGDPEFLTLLGKEQTVPAPVRLYLQFSDEKGKRELGVGLQNALQALFSRYDLTAKTWASMTRQSEHASAGKGKVSQFHEEGEGWLKRGAWRYQLVVPNFLVMFAFFLVLTVGWMFVSERRQGTMLRLRASPLARWQILLGKLIPCYIVSLFQGFILLLAGKVIFNMSWGQDPIWLVPLVFSTSLAAMGLALLVASLAHTETQVAVYGTLLVLVLAGLSGSFMGDRSEIPETLQKASLFTPHAWALDAYRQLLANPGPVDIRLVAESCGVLALFGVIFLALSWFLLRLE